MDVFVIVAILTPIITQIIALAEKKYGKGKGKTKKNWAIKEVGKAWTNAIETGIIPANIAKLPIPLLLPIIGSLIDSLIGVVNENKGIKVKKPN